MSPGVRCPPFQLSAGAGRRGKELIEEAVKGIKKERRGEGV